MVTLPVKTLLLKARRGRLADPILALFKLASLKVMVYVAGKFDLMNNCDDALMVITGGVLSIVTAEVPNGSAVLMPVDKLVALANCKVILPSPVPVFTGTVKVMLSVLVGVPTVAPVTARVVNNEKFDAVKPVTTEANVTV